MEEAPNPRLGIVIDSDAGWMPLVRDPKHMLPAQQAGFVLSWRFGS